TGGCQQLPERSFSNPAECYWNKMQFSSEDVPSGKKFSIPAKNASPFGVKNMSQVAAKISTAPDSDSFIRLLVWRPGIFE
ncbi:MAG: hypothetical protein ACU836_18905, partial [Gammaproteobacteria bacterium]